MTPYVGPDLPLMSSDVRAWLADLMPSEKFFPGPDLPKYPGRCAVVTPSQGGGLTLERAYDQPSFQVHVVGAQSRDGRVNAAFADAERFIFTIDKIILNTYYPTEIAGHRVLYAQRFGSGPTPLPVDSAGRAHFTATYLLEAESGYAR